MLECTNFELKGREETLSETEQAEFYAMMLVVKEAFAMRKQASITEEKCQQICALARAGKLGDAVQALSTDTFDYNEEKWKQIDNELREMGNVLERCNAFKPIRHGSETQGTFWCGHCKSRLHYEFGSKYYGDRQNYAGYGSFCPWCGYQIDWTAE